MFKRTHIKIIMTFFILGIIIITALGIINIVNLTNLKAQIENIDVVIKMETRIQYLIQLLVFIDVIYSLICIIIAIVCEIS